MCALWKTSLTSYEAAVLSYSRTCFQRVCHSPHWGNHMAAADKTKRGSVRIYVSNKWRGDVQTEHTVNIVRWKLSSHCWSAGFLISRGNSVRCFCTAVYRHTSRPANVSSLCRFYHRWRLSRCHLGSFYHCWTFSLAVRLQIPAEKERTAERIIWAPVCRLHTPLQSPQESLQHNQGLLSPTPRARSHGSRTVSILKLLAIRFISRCSPAVSRLLVWLLFLGNVVFSIYYCKCV